MVDRRTRDQKVSGSSPSRTGGRIWSICAGSCFGIRSTSVLPQQHVKDPGHSAKRAGGRLQLNTYTIRMWLQVK